MKHKDNRIKLVNEILAGIKVIWNLSHDMAPQDCWFKIVTGIPDYVL